MHVCAYINDKEIDHLFAMMQSFGVDRKVVRTVLP